MLIEHHSLLFFLFSILSIAIFHYNWFNMALLCCIFIILLLSNMKKKSKFHVKSEYTYVKVLRKFLPTRLLGPTRLLNFRLFSHLHGYLDSTLIRHHRVGKLHIFWEAHKMFQNLHQLHICPIYCQSNMVRILQNFVNYSEYMNFTGPLEPGKDG